MSRANKEARRQRLALIQRARKQFPTLRAFVPTDDDFYPSYLLDVDSNSTRGTHTHRLVAVSLHRFSHVTAAPDNRVSVWGADDMGLEKEYGPSGTEAAAAAMAEFLEILSLKTLSIKWLKDRGFVNA
jgi:hypothetical protein